MSQPQKTTILRLYRNILKHHRAHLPVQLRRLGNETLRHEWKQHKNADAPFVKLFQREWENYLAILQQQQLEQQQQSSSIGRDLDASQAASLNDEQRDSLRQLRDAATVKSANQKSTNEIHHR
jgi:hypothetical protein